MKIGIIGAGNIGSVLARHFQRAGHTVLIANTRGPETLSSVAHETGATPVFVAEAVTDIDVLVLSIPLAGVPALPRDLLAQLPSTVPVIDTGNYYPPRDGRIAEIDAGMMESEWTSHILGRSVIKVSTTLLLTVWHVKVSQRAQGTGLRSPSLGMMLRRSYLYSSWWRHSASTLLMLALYRNRGAISLELRRTARTRRSSSYHRFSNALTARKLQKNGTSPRRC